MSPNHNAGQVHRTKNLNIYMCSNIQLLQMVSQTLQLKSDRKQDEWEWQQWANRWAWTLGCCNGDTASAHGEHTPTTEPPVPFLEWLMPWFHRAWCRVNCVVLLHPPTAPNLSRSISYCCLAVTVLILSFCLQFCDSTMGEYNWNEPHRHRVLYFENWTDVLCCFWVWLPGLVCSVKLKLTWCILSGKPHLGHFCLVEGLE